MHQVPWHLVGWKTPFASLCLALQSCLQRWSQVLQSPLVASARAAKAEINVQQDALSHSHPGTKYALSAVLSIGRPRLVHTVSSMFMPVLDFPAHRPSLLSLVINRTHILAVTGLLFWSYRKCPFAVVTCLFFQKSHRPTEPVFFFVPG